MNEIFERTSVRKFRDKPVEEEKITEILKAAMQAPSSGNQRPWEFYVIKDKDKIKALKESSPYSLALDTAPVAIVLVTKKDGLFPECSDIDMGFAAENILLETVSQGLGGVMLGITPYPERMAKAKEIIDIPENTEVFGIIPIGYPFKITEPEERFEEERIHVIE